MLVRALVSTLCYSWLLQDIIGVVGVIHIKRDKQLLRLFFDSRLVSLKS